MGTRFERRGARRAAVELCEERPCAHGRTALDERSNDPPRRSRGDIGLLLRGERTRHEDVSGHLACGGDDGLDVSRRRRSRRDLLSWRGGAVTTANHERESCQPRTHAHDDGNAAARDGRKHRIFPRARRGHRYPPASQPFPLVPPVPATRASGLRILNCVVR